MKKYTSSSVTTIVDKNTESERLAKELWIKVIGKHKGEHLVIQLNVSESTKTEDSYDDELNTTKVVKDKTTLKHSEVVPTN